MRGNRDMALIVGVALLLCAGRAWGGPASAADTVWKENVAEFDRRMLTPRAEKALGMDIKWLHAETEHFVIHYERAIFAKKVARMAEFFYDYIAADLQGAQDRGVGKSHIFILHSGKRWEELRQDVGGIEAWVFSLVEGPVMYLQQADDTTTSGSILAHEMTHLVFNRFFTGRPPRWLNEGIAEYYEEFAYSAMKGLKKSKRAQFRRLQDIYPLAELLALNEFPADTKKVNMFYETSKYMVGFLLLDRPADQFVPFVNAVLGGGDPLPAFAKHYGIDGLDQLSKEFMKFAR